MYPEDVLLSFFVGFEPERYQYWCYKKVVILNGSGTSFYPILVRYSGGNSSEKTYSEPID
jgi:hypothetical protein